MRGTFTDLAEVGKYASTEDTEGRIVTVVGLSYGKLKFRTRAKIPYLEERRDLHPLRGSWQTLDYCGAIKSHTK